MSGRRFEQLLNSFSVEYADKIVSADGPMKKLEPMYTMLIDNFQNAFYPRIELSLDESLLLHRGRLGFRQYIKGKKAKYGIKFDELCCPDGYILNIEMYKGKQFSSAALTSKIDNLVLRLIAPYLNKGHHLFMDNYYNSVNLSNLLLKHKTHTTGTLRSNRRGNPKCVVQKKLKPGDHIWKRQNSVYISKWKDKRDVLCITTN
ncbi:piggyBac transposable element-derived protein 3-like [Acyrthosiphon pisum]|uniref:PiggyBac transposable element-derived protein domain-containing protein n=1 Tax=Acyrthosiphon pisum TaxID=7029 RepID=A0A8R2BBG1_ACYPI|nr:piggyBac transposable element-derived protein 3-like [Acyrthosiphon pisum]|eukprot:XP_008189696.1 PREDICTED: piggyBac transposable element-derived protein 3-like [Acyrthosiphon pisum]